VDGADEEWPPAASRLTSALWLAEGHLERREFVAAARVLERARGLGEDALIAGLHHLAAAGCRAQTGDLARARRQLGHAGRRLEPYLPEHRGIELRPLLDVTAEVVESAGDGELA